MVSKMFKPLKFHCWLNVVFYFLDIGAAVKEGETLAVYQAVKTVMTVKSPCDGVITDIKSSVSGQPVYTIKPRSDAQLISTEGTVR